MQVFLSRGGQRLGPLAVDSVNQGIAAGQFPPAETVAWWPGCGDWRPLSELPGVVLPSTMVAALPASHFPAPLPAQPQGDATGGVIPYKNAPALISYYLGIAALVPILGVFCAIASIALGIIGLRKRAREPHVKGSIHAWIGIVLGSLSLIVHGFVVAVMAWAAMN